MRVRDILRNTNYNYSITVIDALKQHWKDYNSFSCIGKPKATNLFLYIDGFRAEYETKDGRKFSAGDGDVVYTPIGSEYKVKFINTKSGAYTIGVNFMLHEHDGKDFILNHGISVYSDLGSGFEFLFSKINDSGMQTLPNQNRMKAAFYDILADLGDHYRGRAFGKYNIIADGIIYLQNTGSARQKSIAEIARMCNVSESYFRRLFKEYAGTSPNKYLLESRIKKAKSYLRYDDISIADIAELLGFSDSAYFIKRFHEATGMTPHQYKQSRLR